MGFNGSIVASGRAHAVVVATGERTELDQIAGQMRETGVFSSPLQERMDKFAHIIGLMILIAVAAIPEGLAVVLTVALALGVRRMADRNATIRRLPAVETVGSMTLIGSDKTGTLTENQMLVEQVWAVDDRYVFEEEGLPDDPRDADERKPPGT